MPRAVQRVLLAALGALLALAAPVARSQPAAAVAEQVFSERLHALMAKRQWAEAARHIQQAQALRPVPAWLEGREAEIRLAQVRIGIGRDDVSAALAAARLYLNGDDERSQRLLALAREQHAAGAQAAALGLAREIVRRVPAFSAAARQLKEWEPPVEPAKPRTEAKPPAEPRRPSEPKPSAPAVDEEAALLARLRAAQEKDNVSEMLATARRFLTGDRARTLRLLDVARDYASRGERGTAVALTREVLRHTPDFPPARRLLAELEPGAAAAK